MDSAFMDLLFLPQPHLCKNSIIKIWQEKSEKYWGAYQVQQGSTGTCKASRFITIDLFKKRDGVCVVRLDIALQ